MVRNVPAITDVSTLEDGELVYLVLLGLLGGVADVVTCNFIRTDGDTFNIRPEGAAHDGFKFSTHVADNGTLTAIGRGYLSGKSMLVLGDDAGTAWADQQLALLEIDCIRKEVAERAADVEANDPGSAEAVAETKQMLDLLSDLYRLETKAREYDQAHA